jgi:hypothetical protein
MNNPTNNPMYSNTGVKMQEVNAYSVNYENNDHNNQNQQYAPQVQNQQYVPQNQVVLNQPAHDPSKKYHPYKTPQKPDPLYPFLACGFFTMSLYTEKDCSGSWCQNSTLCCHGEQVHNSNYFSLNTVMQSILLGLLNIQCIFQFNKSFFIGLLQSSSRA